LCRARLECIFAGPKRRLKTTEESIIMSVLPWMESWRGTRRRRGKTTVVQLPYGVHSPTSDDFVGSARGSNAGTLRSTVAGNSREAGLGSDPYRSWVVEFGGDHRYKIDYSELLLK
jgi:hypothetical protein